MSDNLPAVPDAQPSREVATNDVDSWIQTVGQVAKLAEYIAGTEFVPKGLRNSPAAVAAAILYGREVGLPPLTALTQTHVIEGKPSMSAEAMRAMVFATGHQMEFLESTGAICRMRARRSGSDTWTELAWSIDMARAAKLTGKDNWTKYPRAMLSARCTADLARMVFPDVIHGFRAVEEMEDVSGGDADGAPAPSGPTTRVGRKATKKTTAAPRTPTAPVRVELPAGPPLPGEAGYDDQGAAPEQVEGVSGDGSAEVTEGPSDGVGEDIEDAPSTPEPSDPEPAAEQAGPRSASAAQVRMIMSRFSAMHLAAGDKRDARLLVTSTIAGREIDSTNDLTQVEASRVIDTLARVETPEDLVAILDATDEPPEDPS